MSRDPSVGWGAPAALGPAASSRHVPAKRERKPCRNPGASFDAATSPSCSIARLSLTRLTGGSPIGRYSHASPLPLTGRKGAKRGLRFRYTREGSGREATTASIYTCPQTGERHAELSISSTHRSNRALRSAGRASSAPRFFILPPRARVFVCVCSVFWSASARVVRIKRHKGK